MKQTKTDRPDPSLPFTPITLQGREYRMCFDLGALADAEESLLAKGHDVNLLAALPRLNLNTTRILFVASLYAYQPELGYDEAMALITPATLFHVAEGIMRAWQASMPDPAADGKPNPQEPVPA